MSDKQQRFSKVHNEILKRLAHGIFKGIHEAKSTAINHAVNKMLEYEVHPNNFRRSAEALEKRGLISRWKEDLDWYMSITEDGYDLALELIFDEKGKKNDSSKTD